MRIAALFAVASLNVALLWANVDAAQLAARAASDTRRKDYKAAAEDYLELLQLGEDSAELRSNLGMVLYLSGDDRRALEQFRIALTRKPELAASNLFAGLSLIRLGRSREALTLLEKARHQQPDAIAPLLALGRAEMAFRDLPEARAAYSKATDLEPRSAEAWYGRGIVSRELADGALKQASQGNTVGEARQSEVDAARLDLQDAEQSLSRAMTIDPDSLQAHMVMGEAFRDGQQFDSSVAEYQHVIDAKPNYAPGYLGLATTYWRFGRIDETKATLSKVLSLAPEDPEANGIMAFVLTGERRMTEAKPFAMRALASQADQPVARVALAKIYLSENKPDDALKELRLAAPDDVDGSYHYMLATTLRKVGQEKEAAVALERSKELRARQAVKTLP